MHRSSGLLLPVLASLLLALHGCGEEAPPQPPAATTTAAAPSAPTATARDDADPRAEIAGTAVLSNAGTYRVVYRTDPDPIPLNEPFAIELEVFDGVEHDRRLDDVALTIDGRMPDHRHGMNRAPTIVPHGDGRFTVKGMLFHMPGYWELHFDLTAGPMTERAQDEVTLE